MTKEELKNRLIEKKAFWSYDAKNSVISDDLLIESCLIFGDVEDIIVLFKLFEFETIKEVWVTKLVPRDIYYKDNYYLGKIFFEIEDIREFIEVNSKKYSRLERIKQMKKETKIDDN